MTARHAPERAETERAPFVESACRGGAKSLLSGGKGVLS